MEANISIPFQKGNDNARELINKVLSGEEVNIEITIHDDFNDSGYYITTNPNLPIFTDGETIAEVKANFQEAFELFFEEEFDNPAIDMSKIKLLYSQKILLPE